MRLVRALSFASIVKEVQNRSYVGDLDEIGEAGDLIQGEAGKDECTG